MSCTNSQGCYFLGCSFWCDGLFSASPSGTVVLRFTTKDQFQIRVERKQKLCITRPRLQAMERKPNHVNDAVPRLQDAIQRLAKEVTLLERDIEGEKDASNERGTKQKTNTDMTFPLNTCAGAKDCETPQSAHQRPKIPDGCFTSCFSSSYCCPWG